ncbi:MAG TPA: carboxypeptidase-like regulatory domain-containing protein [Terriglobales bacterium]|nr:carboxypeptidase-like regulatory domain-containing protein [Terriglobales bacterium]
MRKYFVLIVSMVLLLGISFAQKDEKKKDDTVSNLNLSVVKATNGKPVRNAAVVLHTLDKDGQQGSGGVNLKTDMEGKTSFPGVPYGKLRVQVIAHGFQTYGEDFDINQPSQEIVIKLKPPTSQYSIYGDDKDKGDQQQKN